MSIGDPDKSHKGRSRGLLKHYRHNGIVMAIVYQLNLGNFQLMSISQRISHWKTILY